MIYACDNCHYLFSETNVVACPDCGKTMVRPATPAEQEDFENQLKRESMDGRNIGAVLISAMSLMLNTYTQFLKKCP